ncbi:MAG TPA: hypothetical protein DDY13_08735 [Cytophagales bacterium]|nr:hypothetical protein [Cytophagales bacterium]
MTRQLNVFLLALFTSLLSWSQEIGLVKRIEKNMKARSIRKDSLISNGRPFLSVFAGPGYTPESGILIGGGLLYTFTTNPDNKELQRSSIPLLGSISTRKNITLSSIMNTFWLDDQLRVKLIAKFSNVNDDYFGVGYETNQSIDRGKETSQYNRILFYLQPKVDLRLLTNFYGGVSFVYSNLKVRETNPVMEEDENFQNFGPEIIETGFAVNLTFDSRDIVVNAYKGWFVNLSYYLTTEFFGGNQNYQVIEYDLRYYRSLNRLGNTLAFRAYGRQAFGEVPYSGMTLIGSTDLLRGYLNGQYRDKAGLAVIGEWRYMFLNKERVKGKHGIATWLGTGSIAQNLGTLSNWLPNAGIGYRLELQPRMNLRIDFGFGRNSSGLYFNFSESF